MWKLHIEQEVFLFFSPDSKRYKVVECDWPPQHITDIVVYTNKGPKNKYKDFVGRASVCKVAAPAGGT